MMMYLQAPVGNETVLGRPGKGPVGFAALQNWEPAWFASGTAALAAATKAAIQLRPVKEPLVILPGYGCPDLVAAARFAGARPFFVDLEPQTLLMDLGLLRTALQENPAVVAVIAVDLFGLPERWSEISRLCEEYNVVCVRDCAQSLQSSELIDADAYSDVRIYSFGRGKPLFLQGGGAALVSSRSDRFLSQDPGLLTVDLPQRHQSVSRLVTALYNAALHPRLYSLVALLLGDRIGDTRYEHLEAIEVLQGGFDAVANEAIQRFWQTFENKQDELVHLLKDLGRRDDAPYSLFNEDTASDCRLLRLPLLMHCRKERDRLIDELRKNGVCATKMYGKALPDINGVGEGTDLSCFPVARDLAERLVTLPVHARLGARDFRVIEAILKNLIAK